MKGERVVAEGCPYGLRSPGSGRVRLPNLEGGLRNEANDEIGAAYSGVAGRNRRPVAADISFDFSFTNVDGNIPGTVTGEIVLPFSGDGTGSATMVAIDTIPNTMTNIYGTTPINVLAWSSIGDNTFTVSSGQITSANFVATDSSLPTGAQAQLILRPGSFASLYFDFTDGSVQDVKDLSGQILITPATINTPEPSTLIIAGMAGVCGIAYGVTNKRRAKRINTTGA